MGLNFKFLSSFFDILLELLRFNAPEMWESITLFLRKFWG